MASVGRAPKKGITRWLAPDKLIWPLLALLLIERLYLFYELPDFDLSGDDVRYVQSAIHFIETGVISYGGPFPTAMIMPGMPVYIGLISLLFGKGRGLWLGARLCGCLLGVVTAWFAYKTTALYSKWGGLLTAAAFLMPNIAWVNHTVLTETPFMLFFTLCLYSTLQMARRDDRKYFVLYVLSFLLALMFRANIITLPLISFAYLFIVRKGRGRLLLKRGLLVGAALLLFALPWSVRNYRHFGEFIPLTNGAGNPMLLGTYQGEGWPEDGELDYKTHVDAVIRELYPQLYRAQPELPEEIPEELAYYYENYDPDGEITDLKMAQVLSLKADQLKARYRLREWFQRDPVSLLKSYLVTKPLMILNYPWSWDQVLSFRADALLRINQLDLVLCVLTAVLSLILKRHRKPILFLAAAYWINLYFISMGLAISRYALPLMAVRYILVGIGLGLVIEVIGKRHRADKPA